MTLTLEGIGVTLAGRPVVDDVTLAVADGGWVTIVGPNGAGKSTLLRAVAGVVRHSGQALVDGTPLPRLGRRERARLVALVPQLPVVPPAMTVSEYVLLGRNPHIALLGSEGAHDLEVTSRAITQLDLRGFADREVATLSGGERQRVLVARALAQEAPILLLDEPTTALDVGHQQEVLELIDGLRSQRSLTVLSTMHDLTLAGQYADHLVLLDRGRVATAGPADEVLTSDNLLAHYGARVRVVDDGTGPIVVPVRPQ